jgi:hypothetical protein
MGKIESLARQLAEEVILRRRLKTLNKAGTVDENRETLHCWNKKKSVAIDLILRSTFL